MVSDNSIDIRLDIDCKVADAKTKPLFMTSNFFSVEDALEQAHLFRRYITTDIACTRQVCEFPEVNCTPVDWIVVIEDARALYIGRAVEGIDPKVGEHRN